MNPKKSLTIVAFGDSITEAGHQELPNRWPVLLSQALQKRFPNLQINVINAGVGGNTSSEGLLRIDQDVLKHKPDFVTVEFGNDGTWEDARRVNQEKFFANFDLINQKVEAIGGKLIVLTFTPVIDRWHQFCDKEFFKQHGGLDAFGEVYRETTRRLARVQNLPLADIDRALRQEIAAKGPESCILPDGCHLTVRGNQILAETVFHVLAAEIEKTHGNGSELNKSERR